MCVEWSFGLLGLPAENPVVLLAAAALAGGLAGAGAVGIGDVGGPSHFSSASARRIQGAGLSRMVATSRSASAVMEVPGSALSGMMPRRTSLAADGPPISVK